MPPTSADGDDEPASAGTRGINPAVNWLLKYQDAPQDMAGTASRTFLGVQIQCAQCHDHKTEKWKQTDFQRFAACFVRTRARRRSTGKMMGQRRVQVDGRRPRPRPALREEAGSDAHRHAPRRARSTAPTSRRRRTSRQRSRAWITAPDNPWFARAIVNRVWGHFLGPRLRRSRRRPPPVEPGRLPELLDALAHDFVAHGYDVRGSSALDRGHRGLPARSAPAGGGDARSGRGRQALVALSR